MPELLIQCIGNRLAGDDGAGPAVADRLQRIGPPRRVVIQELWGEGSALMWQWESADRVIIVDAAAADGGTGGHIHRFDAHDRPVPRDFLYYSSHRFGVAEAIETARALNRLPPRLRLIAIRGNCFDIGTGLSPAVQRSVDQVANELSNIVQRLQNG